MKRLRPSFDDLRLAACAWLGRRVVVFGDMILDEFVYGRTGRVSREAPVVIVRYDGSEWMPGGAANAAQNISALGGVAVPVSVVGGDEAGARLRGILAARGMPRRGLVEARALRTTTKTRVMAGDFHAQRQQVVRIDREEEEPLSRRLEDRVLAALERELARCEAVLMSDYDQRLFSERVAIEAMRMCRARGVPVVVDSRRRLPIFRGAAAATPNEVEAARAAGLEPGDGAALERIGRRLLRTLAARSVLVTRGRFGMALFEPGKRTLAIDVVGSRAATDVTGAGDTVAAATALTLAAGGDMRTAMRLANVAASIVVMKRGTAVASTAEVLGTIDALERVERSSAG